MSRWFIKEDCAARNTFFTSVIGSRRGLSLLLELRVKKPVRYFCARLRGAARGRFVMIENWKEGRIFFFQTSYRSLSVVFLVAECSFFFFFVWSCLNGLTHDSGLLGTRSTFCPPCHGGAPAGGLLFFLVRGPFNSRATEGLNIPRSQRLFVRRQAGSHWERNGCGKKGG